MRLFAAEEYEETGASFPWLFLDVGESQNWGGEPLRFLADEDDEEESGAEAEPETVEEDDLNGFGRALGMKAGFALGFSTATSVRVRVTLDEEDEEATALEIEPAFLPPKKSKAMATRAKGVV